MRGARAGRRTPVVSPTGSLPTTGGGSGASSSRRLRRRRARASLDVGFSEEEFSGTDNFLERHYPYPEMITALGVDVPVTFRDRYPSVTAVHYKGGVFPFEDNQFDVAWSNAVLEHVGDRESSSSSSRRYGASPPKPSSRRRTGIPRGGAHAHPAAPLLAQAGRSTRILTSWEKAGPPAITCTSCRAGTCGRSLPKPASESTGSSRTGSGGSSLTSSSSSEA